MATPTKRSTTRAAASAKQSATRRATAAAAQPATRAAKTVKAGTPAALRRLRAVEAQVLDEADEREALALAEESERFTAEDDDADGEYEDDDADAAYDALHEDEAAEEADEDEDEDEDWADEERERPAEEYSASSYLQGARIWLPSGGYVRVRPVSLIGLINLKALPPNLLAAARVMAFGKAAPASAANRAERRHGGQGGQGDPTRASEVSAQESLAVIDHLCMAAVASFKLVDCVPGRERAGQVSIHSMIEADKLAIANYTMKGQAALRPFRR